MVCIHLFLKITITLFSLKNRFIPAVNVDGYKEVMKVIHNTSERLNIRKNFNKKDCPN